MSEQLLAARRLYDGFAARDGQAVLDALQEDFLGEVSDGMPLGVGGRHEGRDAMLRDCWGPVFATYDMHVEAEEYLDCGSDRVVVTGRYRGPHRAEGWPVDAAFAHVLTIRDGRVAGLRQITDTARWRAPKSGAAGGGPPASPAGEPDAAAPGAAPAAGASA